MTGEELCDLLQVPAEAPPSELLSAWERRRAEVSGALERSDQAKPVKLRLREELRRLDEGAEVAAQLRKADEVEHYLREAEAEAAKPGPAGSILRLCLERAQPLAAELQPGRLRFGLEKRLASLADAVAGSARMEPPSERPGAPAAPPSGRVLELSPCAINGTLRCAVPTVRFIARPQLTLGRGGGADFVVRHWPETEDNRQKTNTISRVNATLTVRAGQICIQDGRSLQDGTSRPSRNGTLVDERRIGASPVPLNFQKERRIKLGQFSFEVAVWHVPSAVRAADLPIPTEGEPLGCVRVQAAGEAYPRIGIWLLSDAALGSGPDSAVALDAGMPAVAARIHQRGGEFWLQVPPGAKSLLNLDGRRRVAGDFAPLRAEHELRLGDYAYTLRIE